MKAKKSTSTDPARTIYGEATTILRTKHKAEFEAIIDGLYADKGLQSPNAKRKAAAEARKAQTEAVAQRKAAKAVERIARLEAELEAARKAVEAA